MASIKSREPAKPQSSRKPANLSVSKAAESAAKVPQTLTAIAEVEENGGSDDDPWTLRLYIAGDSPKSRTALANLQRLCDTHLKGKYEIEVIDLKTRPELAKADQILALPTLIRKIPEPMKRLIGDLSNPERALVALELGGVAAAREGSKHVRHPD